MHRPRPNDAEDEQRSEAEVEAVHQALKALSNSEKRFLPHLDRPQAPDERAEVVDRRPVQQHDRL